MTTARYAGDADAGAVARLLGRARAAIAPPRLARGKLVVLDGAGGELCAIVHLVLDAGVGRVDALVVDPRFHGTGLEARMLGVACSLCAAHGCGVIELAAA